jgi:hypothetical protein
VEKLSLLYRILNEEQLFSGSTEMIQAGTSPDMCTKVIVPGIDHGDGVLPCMIQGILFLKNLRSSKYKNYII